MPVIIDGYNLLRSIQKTNEELLSIDEVALCRILSEYMICARTRGHIIFDGTGPNDKSDMDRLGGLKNLEVYFSGPHTDADSVIEQKILDNTAPRSLIVVSSDRRIQTAAAKRKAQVLTSEMFWPMAIKLLDRKTASSPEPRAKRQGITEAEADQWLDYFGINPKD